MRAGYEYCASKTGRPGYWVGLVSLSRTWPLPWVGAVHINAMSVHDEPGLPHGGVKMSGEGAKDR